MISTLLLSMMFCVANSEAPQVRTHVSFVESYDEHSKGPEKFKGQVLMTQSLCAADGVEVEARLDFSFSDANSFMKFRRGGAIQAISNVLSERASAMSSDELRFDDENLTTVVFEASGSGGYPELALNNALKSASLTTPFDLDSIRILYESMVYQLTGDSHLFYKPPASLVEEFLPFLPIIAFTLVVAAVLTVFLRQRGPVEWESNYETEIAE